MFSPMGWSSTTLRATILAMMLGAGVPGSGQTVFIPDTNLRQLLSAWAPGAVDGNGFLDPQHPNVLAKSWLSVDAEMDWDPVDLTGLDALDQLDSLNVTFVWTEGQVTLASFDTVPISVPAWPPNLTRLNLFYGTYASLPAWPAGLTQLSYNLPSGPSTLPPFPSSLTELAFTAGADLIALPDLPEGIQTLDLSAPSDNVVPALPMSVTTLTISGFGAVGVAAWPSSLTRLVLTNIVEWTSLPAWPSGLVDLAISGADGLSALPSAWPTSLTDLNLSDCSGLVELPPFPSGLLHLFLTGLPALGTLPGYPTSLESLYIGGLGVSTLPAWPVGPDHINIGAMVNLVTMPDFPPTTTWISISGNLPVLAAFPDWPGSLSMLSILAGDIPVLPDLPASLTSLELSGTNLDCVPVLPDGLGYFMCYGCGISCIPNAPAGLYYENAPDMGPDPLPPLCTVLNSTCDFLNPAATGTVYWDQNANGVRDGGEPGYADATIHIQPGSILTGVNTMGDFNIGLPLDQYTLTATSGNPYVQSIVPASHDAPFVNTTDVDSGNDFGVVLQADVQDVRIDLDGPWGRPGLETWGGITYDNIGSTTVSGTITLQLDPMLSWVESTPPPTSVSGNTITWDYAGLQFGERRSIGFTVYTDPGVPLGTQLQHTATAGPVVSDETPADNTATSNTVVEGSWDPNDKRVEPATLTPADVAAGGEIIYTIRFQNTGTYQADRVIVLDTLSVDLQWNTMRFINSSHPCTWVLSGGGVLRFTFDPIFLPDSASDEPNSHGFVRFSMKPVSDLMPGQSVANTAGIIFDFNAPVLTAPAVFTVETSTGLAEPGPEGPWAWPNPVVDALFVRGAAGRTAEVRDLTGRLVLRERCGGGAHALDVHSLAAGSYLLRVSGAGSCVFIKR